MLRLGYFNDFLERQTLLVDGDAHDLKRLVVDLKRLAVGEGNTPLPPVWSASAKQNRALSAEVVSGGGPVLSMPSNDAWTWRHSSDEWLEVAEGIEVLADANQPCHQYFDDDGERMVMVTTGEYGERWWDGAVGR